MQQFLWKLWVSTGHQAAGERLIKLAGALLPSCLENLVTAQSLKLCHLKNIFKGRSWTLRRERPTINHAGQVILHPQDQGRAGQVRSEQEHTGPAHGPR